MSTQLILPKSHAMSGIGCRNNKNKHKNMQGIMRAPRASCQLHVASRPSPAPMSSPLQCGRYTIARSAAPG